MTMLNAHAFAQAETYLIRNARLIDRLRYAHLFLDGSPHRVVDALRPYQNSDGGFSYALEPDLRGSHSQPQHLEVALWTLAESLSDDTVIQRACDWLAANSTDQGGVPFVLANVTETERAFWWEPEAGPSGPPANINPTGPIVGLLHEMGCEHPWLGPATDFCWNYLAEMSSLSEYDALATLAFLERIPDRSRAEAEFSRLSDSILETVTFDPDAPGHVHFPLDFAPTPRSMARRLFSADVIEQHLQAMIHAQEEDGSWSANFPMWTPVVRHEWGGFLTLTRLKTLRAYGRLESR